MTPKSSKQKKSPLEDVAREFAASVVKTANDKDPTREAEFQKREAARDAAVTEALKRHLAKRKK